MERIEIELERIELDCRTCENCTGYSCKLYGADADKAIKACAETCFENYKEKSTPQPYKEGEKE